jgi:hypothetical protein
MRPATIDVVGGLALTTEFSRNSSYPDTSGAWGIVAETWMVLRDATSRAIRSLSWLRRSILKRVDCSKKRVCTSLLLKTIVAISSTSGSIWADGGVMVFYDASSILRLAMQY